jgi:hypothetical protein
MGWRTLKPCIRLKRADDVGGGVALGVADVQAGAGGVGEHVEHVVLGPWADGEIQSREREAILEAANGRGIEKGSTTCQILENWLNHKPSDDIVKTWKHYVHEISASMDESRRATFRDGVLAQAKNVAEAAGGFLGLGSKVSDAEAEALEDLASAFE